MMFERANTVWLVAGGIAATVAYAISRVISHRRFYSNLPGPPHSMIWGHVKIMGEYLGRLPKGTYMQAALTQIKQDYDLPDVFYMDMWPFGPRFLMLSAPDAAALPTTVSAFPQSRLVTEFFVNNLGPSFIEASNGTLWKELHQILAPGLTPGAVRTYHDFMVDEAVGCHDRLRRIVEAGKAIDFNEEVGKFPAGVIMRVIFGDKEGIEVMRSNYYMVFRDLSDAVGALTRPIDPITKWKFTRQVHKLVKVLETMIEERVRSRFVALQNVKVLPNRNTATNIIDRLIVARVANNEALDDGFMKIVFSNINGFLAAGTGTSNDTLSYVFMLLQAFPETLEKLREEHDRVFDKDYEKTLSMLRENPGSIKDLEYTTAVIQETLRMFPIGLIIRDPPPDMTTLEYKGKTFPIKGHTLGITHHALHYDPNIFDEPNVFKPERFLASEPTFPRAAYRPFERGLRSCLGQHLAMEEMRVALLMVARWFDWELLDHEPAAKPLMGYSDLDTKIGLHTWQKFRLSAGPNGSVMMKFKLADKER